MKIETTLSLEGGERYLIDTEFNQALNLVGWQDHDKDFQDIRTRDIDLLDEVARDQFRSIKAVRKIRGGQFSMEDIERADRFIRSLAAKNLASAEAGGVFLDPHLDATFSDGVRSSAQLAIRKLESFRETLQEFIAETTGEPVLSDP
jgi:hypothetical protein